MKKVSLSDAKAHLSRHVEHVRRGGRVRILVRGRAVADLVPVAATAGDPGSEEARLAVLEQRGLIRRGPGGMPPEIMKPAPRATGRPLSALVVDERRAGR